MQIFKYTAFEIDNNLANKVFEWESLGWNFTDIDYSQLYDQMNKNNVITELLKSEW